MGCSKSDKSTDVVKIVIHYAGWNIDVPYPWSCDDVKARGDSVVVKDQGKIREFVSIIDGLRLVELPGYDSIDARICILFYDKEGRTRKSIRIAVPRHFAIAERVFEPNDILFDLVVSYLPEDYLEE